MIRVQSAETSYGKSYNTIKGVVSQFFVTKAYSECGKMTRNCADTTRLTSAGQSGNETSQSVPFCPPHYMDIRWILVIISPAASISSPVQKEWIVTEYHHVWLWHNSMSVHVHCVWLAVLECYEAFNICAAHFLNFMVYCLKGPRSWR